MGVTVIGYDRESMPLQYEYSDGAENFRKMSADFPGTAVTIEVNTADESTYVLSDETARDEIF